MNFFFDTINPTPPTPESIEKFEISPSAKRILSFKSLLRHVTHLFGFSVKLKTDTVSISSVSTYIRDSYFSKFNTLKKSEQDKLLTSIKTSVKSISSEKANQLGLREFISEVVSELATKETIPKNVQKSKEEKLSDLIQKALSPETLDLEQTQKLESFFDFVSTKNEFLHPSKALIENIHARVKEQKIKALQDKFDEIKSKYQITENLKEYKVSELEGDSYDQTLGKLKQLETYYELEILFSQSYVDKTSENGKRAQELLKTIKTSLTETLLNKKLTPLTKEMMDEAGNLVRTSLEESLSRKLNEARATIIKELKLPKNLDNRALVAEVQKQAKTSAIQASIILQEQNSIEAFLDNKSQDLNKELEVFLTLLLRSPDLFEASMISLFARAKITLGDSADKISLYYTECKNPEINTLLKGVIKNKNLPIEIHKIAAQREDIAPEVRLFAAANLAKNEPEKTLEILRTALNKALESKTLKDTDILTALAPFEEMGNPKLLLSAFKDKTIHPFRERLLILIHSSANKPLQDKLSSAAGFDFGPLKEAEHLTSSLSRNTIITLLPPMGDITTDEKALSLEIAKLREQKVSDVHLICIKAEGSVTAHSVESFRTHLASLHELSAKFPGITFIPGKILLEDMVLIPVFEGGRLVSLGKNASHSEKILPSLFFLTPNGTSMALGSESYDFKQEHGFLPINEQPLDCQIVLSNIPQEPIVGKKGLFIQSKLEAKTSTLVTSHDREVGKEHPPGSFSIGKIGEDPLNIFQDLKLDESSKKEDISATEKTEIIKLLEATPSKGNSPETIVEEIKNKYLFSSENERKSFQEAIEGMRIPSEYPQQFLTLLSQAKAKDHSIVVYTENPSLPIQIYKNGVCSYSFTQEDLLPGKNRTILAHSLTKKSFYSVPKPPEATEEITKEYEKFRLSFSVAVKSFAEKAATFSHSSAEEMKELDDSFEIIKARKRGLNDWLYSNRSVSEFLWKQSKVEDLHSKESAIKVLSEYRKQLKKLFSSKDSATLNTSLDLMYKSHENVRSALKAFLSEQEVEQTLMPLATISRAYDTMATLIDLGRDPSKASSLIVKDGRFVSGTPSQNRALELANCLEEIKPTILVLKNNLDEEDLKALLRALDLLQKGLSSQGQGFVSATLQFFGASKEQPPELIENLIKVANELKEKLKAPK